MRTYFRSLSFLFLASSILSSPLPAQQEPPELVTAINDGELEKVRELLDAGADPNLTFYDRTPLMFSIYGNHVEIFHVLVEHGADLEVRPEEVGPLIGLAGEVGNIGILEFLLEQGAEINDRAPNGQTPLMLAVYNGHPEAAKFLIGLGADLDAQEGSGWTALMLGAMKGDLTSVEYLIEGGCDVNLKTNDGESPLTRARLLAEQTGMEGDYEGIIVALIAAGAGGA